MKQIYVLQGPHDSGKTSTVREIYNIINQKYPNATEMRIHKKNNAWDITYILEIVDEEKGKIKIGINSGGDALGCIYEPLNTFNSEGCDLIFCACSSTYGQMTEFIDSFQKEYKTFYIHKLKNILNTNNLDRGKENSAQAQENQAIAEHIVNCAFTLL